MNEIIWIANQIATIDRFLDQGECTDLIELAERCGFGEAPINAGPAQVVNEDVRNNQRVMLDDQGQAEILWSKLRPCLSDTLNRTWRPVGLNERLRFYRYQPGQRFDWHLDGAYARPNRERSIYTFMVYLNDGFTGGATSFRGVEALTGGLTDLDVTPQTGMALLFEHRQMHTGRLVESGVKYALRTDVMYAPIT